MGYSYINDSVTLHSVAFFCDTESDEHGKGIIISTVSNILKILSSVLLIITAIIYTLLPQLKDVQGICTLHFLVNYSIVYITVNVIHYSRIVICLSKGKVNIDTQLL